jgi:hypothetical protein
MTPGSTSQQGPKPWPSVPLPPFGFPPPPPLPAVLHLCCQAFPELQMNTAAIAGVPLTPAAIADDKGNVLVMSQSASPAWAERALRAACDALGCSVGLASTPMEGCRAKQVGGWVISWVTDMGS